jgi:hypothetical protein
MRESTILTATTLLGLSATAVADDQQICADRPGKSSQACTVPAGHFQFESSIADWTLTKGGGERDTALAIGETGFKYGLTDRSHIDVDITPWERVTSRGGSVRDHASGFGDILVNYKYRMTAADAAFALAISPFIKIPTAKRPLGNRRLEAGLLVPMQYSLPHSQLALSFTPEVDWSADSDGHGHHVAASQVVNLGWQATPKLNLSGEVWSQWDWDPAGTGKQVSADGAVAYLVNNKVQLDAGANFGLNRQTPDIDVYTGIAVQF